MTKYRVIEVLLADGSIGYGYEWSMRFLFWDLWNRSSMISRNKGEIVEFVEWAKEREVVKKLRNVDE